VRYITLTARVALRSITFIDSQISSDAIVVSEPELIVPSDPDSVLNNVHHRASVTTVSHSKESYNEVRLTIIKLKIRALFSGSWPSS